MTCQAEAGVVQDDLLTREWLVTNGLGGYASGTIGGVRTRRYHGLLIAALPAPLGRSMMFNQLTEQILLPGGTRAALGGVEREGRGLSLDSLGCLAEFRLEDGLPVWRYELERVVVEKRVLMVHMQNTVHITYSLVSGQGPVWLELRPSVHFRSHTGQMGRPLAVPYQVTAVEDRFEIRGNPEMPALRLKILGEAAALTLDGSQTWDLYFRDEASRGDDARGLLWTPGYFGVTLYSGAGREATLIASTETWNEIQTLLPVEALSSERERRRRLLDRAYSRAQSGPPGELVLAADQFIISPAGRTEDATRARAAGDEVRTVIAGYHWFTDWGRDTMISLEGLTLVTGRHHEAGWILRTFAYYVRDGLIPNLFPEDKIDGLYHTADATLWYFHAIDRYMEYTGDRETLRRLLPKLRDIVEHHLRGTRFGIGVDSNDGLLRQGAEGYQLTWMDAKVEEWVVTPRRGKAVEINALWYNALRLLEKWLREENEVAAEVVAEHARRAKESFNRRFWYAEGGYLYDGVDGEWGDDFACRPNQILAISLRFPVLDEARWEPVLQVVQDRLLTPVGLRSLAPGSPDYRVKYFGDRRARDAAYHQGTVWAWLIGPFIDAWLRVHPKDKTEARNFLEGLVRHLGEGGMGTISEIFDAEPPYVPRGCIAQAWSVAECLRAWIKTEEH